jgi:hypothetical protein
MMIFSNALTGYSFLILYFCREALSPLKVVGSALGEPMLEALTTGPV